MGPAGSEDQHVAMLEEMNRHQQEVATLSQTLARLGKPNAGGTGPGADPRAVLLTADRTKHLISIALLSARLRRSS